MNPQYTANNTQVIHEHTSDAHTIPQVDKAAGAEGQALPTQGQCVSNPVDESMVASRDSEKAIRADRLAATPNERNLLTKEDAAAKKQLKQFRSKISRYRTSNGSTFDCYTANCRGWAKAIAATSGAYYVRHVQDGALPQETFIFIAREIFEPIVQRCCDALLEIACAKQCIDQVSKLCDDITRALDQFEQAWTQSSLISRQPQVIPAKIAFESALKRLDAYRSILTKQSPPVRTIKIAVAVKRYSVSSKTLIRAVADGRLTDYRKLGHATNTPFLLCEDEVAQYYKKR